MNTHEHHTRTPADQLVEALDELSFQLSWALLGPEIVEGPGDGRSGHPGAEQGVQDALDLVRRALAAYRHPRKDVTDHV